MKIKLQIQSSTEPIRLETLAIGVYRIGRSEFCDIVLSGDSISRSHIELRVTKTNVYLTNMTTVGRVKVNGDIVETAELHEGDEIKIGPYSITLRKETENQIQSPAPAKTDSPDKTNLSQALPEFDEPLNHEIQSPTLQLPTPENARVFATDGANALATDTLIGERVIVAKLLFTHGIKENEEIALESYEVTLGRSRKADVFIDDEKLSRYHAKIARVGQGYRLIDLGSRNGTYVNGVRVLEHPLTSFDIIELGNQKIRFLIQDVKNINLPDEQPSKFQLRAVDSTRSIVMPSEPQMANDDAFPNYAEEDTFTEKPKKSASARILLWSLLLVFLGYLAIDGSLLKQNEPKPVAILENPSASALAIPQPTSAPVVSNDTESEIPSEFQTLPIDIQRQIESKYQSARSLAGEKNFDPAIGSIQFIHDYIPYYKDSRNLEIQYENGKKELAISQAQEKAAQLDANDAKVYIEDGYSYLKQSNFQRAQELFQSALNIDPKNESAALGLKAADAKVTDVNDIPKQVDPEIAKREQVTALFQKSVKSFYDKSYQDAINFAEEIRKIEIKGETSYLNEAKQIIDRSKIMQAELFEPFLIQAKEKYAEGNYKESRELCEDMLTKDPSYGEANECALKAAKQLNRLAKEAYTYGYILESMNRIDDAKQYWNRARNYVRDGDEYYKKVMQKLEQYQ